MISFILACVVRYDMRCNMPFDFKESVSQFPLFYKFD